MDSEITITIKNQDQNKQDVTFNIRYNNNKETPSFTEPPQPIQTQQLIQTQQIEQTQQPQQTQQQRTQQQRRQRRKKTKRVPPSPSNQCLAKNQKHNRCRKKKKDGCDFCKEHLKPWGKKRERLGLDGPKWCDKCNTIHVCQWEHLGRI